MPDDPTPLYRVDYTALTRKRLKRWAEQSIQFGIGEQFVAALKSMDRGLPREPLSWGDPLYHLPNLGIVVCHRLCLPLSVIYGVDEVKRIVYVQRVKPYSTHPFTEDS